MQYRLDKRSGNRLSALGMGCMRLPGTFGSPDLKSANALIMEAIDLGINFFDTAYLYHGSEAALGYVLEKNNVRDKVYIATKLPLFKCHAYEDFDRLFAVQLQRLKTDYVDYYFMHNMTKLTDWQRLCDLGIERWIAEKQKAGQIRQVGFSFHGTRHEFPKLLDSYDWDFCMIQYNYINVNYQAGEAGLKYAHEKGISVFIMEPLLGGRLAKDLPAEAVKVFAKQNNDPPVAWALRWLLNQPEVTLVLSGMNESAQLIANAAVANNMQAGGMTGEEEIAINQAAEIFSASYKIPCTGCNYCLPCPAKINIPDSFMAYNASYAISRFTGIQQYATTSGGLSRDFSLSDCTRCGKCEKACPQEIAIVKRLSEVRKRMEPWWFRAAMSIVRRVMK